MNIKNLAGSLLATNTVQVTFQTAERFGEFKSYTYLTDIPLEENDWVLVPNAKDMANVAQVIHVDDDVDIDVTSEIEYKFILAKVDRSPHVEREDKLNQLITKLNAGRKASAQNQALAMLGINKEDLGDLLKLESK